MNFNSPEVRALFQNPTAPVILPESQLEPTIKEGFVIHATVGAFWIASKIPRNKAAILQVIDSVNPERKAIPCGYIAEGYLHIIHIDGKLIELYHLTRIANYFYAHTNFGQVWLDKSQVEPVAYNGKPNIINLIGLHKDTLGTNGNNTIVKFTKVATDDNTCFYEDPIYGHTRMQIYYGIMTNPSTIQSFTFNGEPIEVIEIDTNYARGIFPQGTVKALFFNGKFISYQGCPITNLNQDTGLVTIMTKDGQELTCKDDGSEKYT